MHFTTTNERGILPKLVSKCKSAKRRASYLPRGGYVCGLAEHRNVVVICPPAAQKMQKNFHFKRSSRVVAE